MTLMAALYVFWPQSRLLDGSSQMEAKITFSPFTCVSLYDEYWLDGLCSNACTVSMVMNSLKAVTIVLLSYSTVTSCRGQVWTIRGNNWDNYSQIQAKINNTCIMLLRSGCENSLCCSVHHMISYDLLIAPPCNVECNCFLLLYIGRG